MKTELSIQVYSVRDRMTTEADTADTFQKLSSYGYTGIQTAGPFHFGVEKYAELAKSAGLRVVGTHQGLDALLDVDETVRVHKILGTTNAGIGSLPGVFDPNFDPKSVAPFVEKVNRLAAALGTHGIRFTLHHHALEFARVGNETVMDILVRELDPKNTAFVLDTCWLQLGGVSVTEWIEKLAGRVDILHLKDVGVHFGNNACVMTELGNGNMNLKEIVKVAKASGVQHLCYELDDHFAVDSMTSAKVSAEHFFSITE